MRISASAPGNHKVFLSSKLGRRSYNQPQEGRPRDTATENGVPYFAALRKYSMLGMWVCKTVLVTETGSEVLTNFPRELYLAK